MAAREVRRVVVVVMVVARVVGARVVVVVMVMGGGGEQIRSEERCVVVHRLPHHFRTRRSSKPARPGKRLASAILLAGGNFQGRTCGGPHGSLATVVCPPLLGKNTCQEHQDDCEEDVHAQATLQGLWGSGQHAPGLVLRGVWNAVQPPPGAAHVLFGRSGRPSGMSWIACEVEVHKHPAPPGLLRDDAPSLGVAPSATRATGPERQRTKPRRWWGNLA